MIFFHNKKRIHYSDIGKGTPIVLVHGFLESSQIWEQLVVELSSSRRVICIDLPGHGKSEVQASIHSMELFAECVRSLLKHLNVSNFNIMGHSMGGYVALAYIELYPSEISQIILLNSTTVADSATRLENRRRALQLIPKNPESFIAMAIRNLFAPSNRQKFETQIDLLKDEALTFPLEGILAAVRGMMQRPDRSNILKNFKGTKLIITATDDPIVPISEIKEVAIFTNSELKKVPGGHMSLTENYAEILKIVHFIE